MSRIPNTAEKTRQETLLRTVITLTWTGSQGSYRACPWDRSSQLRVEQAAMGGKVSFGGAVSYGWSSLLRVEQSATVGAVSYSWSSQLRVEQSATGGAVSYGWSSQLRVEQSATGGAVCYGWSRQLRVEQSATGGAVSYSWSSQLRVEQRRRLAWPNLRSFIKDT